MPCDDVDLGNGVRAIVCSRGQGRRQSEEEAILEDIRRNKPVPTSPGQCPDCRWNNGTHHPACKRGQA